MLVGIENDSFEVSPPITREELINTYRYRMAGLLVTPFLDQDVTRSEIEEIGVVLIESIYRSITEPNYRPDKSFLETYDKLGRLLEFFEKIDGQNYIPASEYLDDVHVKTFKQLQTVLREHPEIQRNKPSPQRLMINAADWARHIRDLDRQANHAIDAADDFADEAKERQERLRDLKMAEFIKKMSG